MERHEVELNEKVGVGEGNSPLRTVAFIPLEEEWSYYKADGGYVVAIKTIPLKMYDSDRRTADGIPQFLVSAQNAVVTMTQEEYESRRKLKLV